MEIHQKNYFNKSGSEEEIGSAEGYIQMFIRERIREYVREVPSHSFNSVAVGGLGWIFFPVPTACPAKIQQDWGEREEDVRAEISDKIELKPSRSGKRLFG